MGINLDIEGWFNYTDFDVEVEHPGSGEEYHLTVGIRTDYPSHNNDNVTMVLSETTAKRLIEKLSEGLKQVHNARSRGEDVEPFEETRPVESIKPDWKTRDLVERVAAIEEQLRKVTSVWRLWLNDAARGAINPGTFDTMRTLLGMSKHE